ncbi:MAG: YcaO-like family protein [Bryobacteraceae bacterium]|nr:YcaO-like family protein [Bryobacteraceae bacterium]
MNTADLVNERVGIVHSVESLPTRAGSPKFFHYSAQLCNLAGCGLHPVSARLDGTAAERERALTKVMAEALRYYCAAFYDPDDLPMGCASDFSFDTVPGHRFALFSPEQYLEPDFPYMPLTPETPVRWTPAVEYTTGKTTYVPASFVRLPYRVKSWSGEVAVNPVSSAGLAVGPSFEDAALNALCGAIEADALSLIWQLAIVPSQLRVETLSDRNYDVVSRFEKTLGSVTLLHADVGFGVPSILASLRATVPGAPSLVFAAGTSPDPGTATSLALDNLALTLRYALEIKAHVAPPDQDAGLSRIATSADHLNYWAQASNAAGAAFLFTSKKRIESSELAAPKSASKVAILRDLVGRISREGHSVVFADLTTRDVRELGFSVVRAVVPGLHPLFAGYRYRARGGTRLATISARFARSRAGGSDMDNPLPHPFLIGGADS